MKFAPEARPSQYIVPFGNTEPTCMPLSGHFMDIGPIVRDGEISTQPNLMPHGDKGRFLVLMFTPHLSSTKLL